MGLLVKKIDRSRWDPDPEESNGDSIQADALTLDLTTRSNCTSFWRCPVATENELKEVVLALAITRDYPNTMDIVWIDEDSIREIRILTRETEGNTYVEDLRDKHIDAVKLDLDKIYSLAKKICLSIRADSNCKRFRKKEIIQILQDAVDQGRFSIDDPRIKETLRKHLRK